MVTLNYFRIKNAVQNLEEQKKKILDDKQFFIKWKPVILSLLQEYLGEEDDIYKAVSDIKVASYDTQKVSLDYYEGYILHTKGVVVKFIEDAIIRVKQGRLQPQKHNFFARIPLPNAIAIYIALLIAPLFFAYNVGKDNGKLEYRNQVESQTSQIDVLKQENTNLLLTVGIVRDSLSSCKAKIEN